MKNIKRLILLLSALTYFGNVFAQWEVKHIKDSISAHPYSSNTIRKIIFTTKNVGIAIGYGFMLRSDDTGNNWNNVYSDNTYELIDVFALNDTVIFTCARKYKEPGILIKSIDAGLSWNKIYTIPNSEPSSIWFINSDTGFVGCFNGFYRTFNGGLSWDIVFEDNFPSKDDFYVTQIKFISNTTGYAIVNTYPSDFLLKTNNSGISWDTQILPNPIHYVSDLFCLDENSIYLSSRFGAFHSTINGGRKWKTETVYAYDNGSLLNSIFFTSGLTGYAVSGRNWDFTGVDLWSASFYSGFKICTTRDSGKTWECFDSNGILLTSVYFLNDSVGFVAGSYELIMKTTTGGGTGINGNYPWWLFNGIQENKLSVLENIRVYPTLFNDQISIEFLKNPPKEKTSIRLINSLGQEVLSSLVLPGETLKSLNTCNIARGFYLLELQNKNSSKSFKLMKE